MHTAPHRTAIHRKRNCTDAAIIHLSFPLDSARLDSTGLDSTGKFDLYRIIANYVDSFGSARRHYKQ